ncbi:MAG TPA: hypothetical protein VHL11_12335 [Phototrophicaceae bacterium]|nr:hypothetical protein [Phototrophicaceae bacterium]
MKMWVASLTLALLLPLIMWTTATPTKTPPPPQPTNDPTAQPDTQAEGEVFLFDFPLEPSTEDVLTEGYDCVLIDIFNEETEPAETPTTESCKLANQALEYVIERGEDTVISDEEQQVLIDLTTANPALLLRLPVIASYYDKLALVAPPDFTAEPIVEMHFIYKFSGLGNPVNYDITITTASSEPVVSGTAGNGVEGYMPESTHEPAATPEVLPLPETIDPAVIQAFAPALRDLIPIGQQFSSVVCYDYYPDWTITLTFASGEEVTLVTNNSNVIGVGGPWQTEIDGQNYLQYSGAIANAALGVLDALGLSLGETAAMTCGGADDPMFQAYPKSE